MRVVHDAAAKIAARVMHRLSSGADIVRHSVVPMTRVEQSADAYHQTQGWVCQNHVWRGEFHIPGLSCPGEIWTHYGKLCARIANVPPAVLNGPHSACFSTEPDNPGWYRIHFSHMPKTVDGAILAVEQRLQEVQ